MILQNVIQRVSDGILLQFTMRRRETLLDTRSALKLRSIQNSYMVKTGGAHFSSFQTSPVNKTQAFFGR